MTETWVNLRHKRLAVTLVVLAAAALAMGGSARSVTAKPDAESTGPRVALRPSGPLTVTTNGATIEGLDIDGCVRIRANNVTLRDVRVICSGPWGVYTERGYGGTTIEYSEVFMKSCGDSAVSPRARRIAFSELRGCGDGAKLDSDTLVEHNYIHMRKPCGSSIHLDGLQSMGAHRLKVLHNNIDMPATVEGCANGNAAIIFQTEFSSSSDIVIDQNWLNGGNYTIFINAKSHGCPTNVRITNNKMGRDYRYGVYYPGRCGEFVADNTWEDTGEPTNKSGPLRGGR